MSDVRAQIDRYLDPGAVERVHRYFFGVPVYTGQWFERLGGGGDRAEVAGRFTGDDVVAVSMLGVNVPALAAVALLETRAAEFGGILAAIPNGIDLWAAPVDEVGPRSAADELWHELVEIEGVEWVTAGKLLARKRPRLLPVYDSVVRAAIPVEDWWISLREALLGADRRRRLEELRGAAGLGPEISLLRVLDVAIWMTDRY